MNLMDENLPLNEQLLFRPRDNPRLGVPEGEPTPTEISAATAEIRKEWTAKDYSYRSGTKPEKWDLPVVQYPWLG